MGALAVSYYGDIFTTRDADFLVFINVPAVAEDLYYTLRKHGFSCRNLREFVRKILWRKVVRCYDEKTIYYIDIISVLKISEQKSIEFRRRVEIFGQDCWITPPEPLIVSKLSRMSCRDIEHIMSIIRRQKDSIDWKFLWELAEKENVANRLKKILNELNIKTI